MSPGNLQDVLDFVVRQEAVSVGSRSSGKQLRLKLENLVSTHPDCRINVDFEGISVVSSGFADEFLGRLFVRMGALRFMSTIRPRTVSPEVRALLDQAIVQRVQWEARND